MASRRIHKTSWVLVFVYTFCNHGPLTHHWIDVTTRILEISSMRDDIDEIASLLMTLRSMATAPRIHKTRQVLDIVYTFCKHGAVTHHLINSSTWNWDISSTRDDIDGIAPSSTTLRSTLVLPKSTKQGEFCFSCIHFANRNHVLTSWLMYPDTDLGNIVCDGRYRLISSLSTTMLLFFLLFGVRPNRYLMYRTNIYGDRRSCFLYFQSTDAQTSAATCFYFMLCIRLEDLATCATRILNIKGVLEYYDPNGESILCPTYWYVPRVSDGPERTSWFLPTFSLFWEGRP
jgi:hypothetical protein